MRKSWIIPLIAVIAIGVIVLTGCGSDEAVISEGGIVVNTNPQQTGIWVNGEGKVLATPDLAEINLGIEVEADTVEEAQAQAAESMDAVMVVLGNAGIEDEDIQTSRFSISPIRKWDDEDDEYILVGYRVNNSVSVKIRELDQVGVIIDSVAEAGGDFTRIDGISFSVEDPTPFKDLARDDAFAQAKAKAEQLAELSDMKLGTVTYVTESSFFSVPVRYAADEFAAGAMAEVSTPISPGEQEITVNLQVAFELSK